MSDGKKTREKKPTARLMAAKEVAEKAAKEPPEHVTTGACNACPLTDADPLPKAAGGRGSASYCRVFRDFRNGTDYCPVEAELDRVCAALAELRPHTPGPVEIPGYAQQWIVDAKKQHERNGSTLPEACAEQLGAATVRAPRKWLLAGVASPLDLFHSTPKGQPTSIGAVVVDLTECAGPPTEDQGAAPPGMVSPYWRTTWNGLYVALRYPPRPHVGVDRMRACEIVMGAGSKRPYLTEIGQPPAETTTTTKGA